MEKGNVAMTYKESTINNQETNKDNQYLNSYEHQDLRFFAPGFDDVKIKKSNILDKEMGTLRGNYTKTKIFFKKVYLHLKSFFTKKKMQEIKSVFSFIPPNTESSEDSSNILPNIKNKQNEYKH